MPLTMPQPDFEPALRLHLNASYARLEVGPDRGPGRFMGPGDDDDDPVEDARRASHLLIVHGDRR
jgi:hypothetical protein